MLDFCLSLIGQCSALPHFVVVKAKPGSTFCFLFFIGREFVLAPCFDSCTGLTELNKVRLYLFCSQVVICYCSEH